MLAARLHAATYELLMLIREFDACNGWSNGFRSCAHWLHWRTGIDLGAAREKVRVARALAHLPQIGTAMAGGELSYAKVRALTRVATPENERRLLDVALAGTAAQVERLVRAWRRADRLEASHQAERRHQERQLVTWTDDDGMLVIRGRLSPEAGAVVQRALEAAADQLFRELADAPDTPVTGDVTPAQRRADAIVLLAETALASGMAGAGTADRYQVVVHVEPRALQGTTAPTATDGHATVELDDAAIDVSAETSQRLACDSSIVVMRHGANGGVLDVGRRRRSIPAAIRRALAARDTRCQFPGCTARRCDAHHISHWADGGPTSLTNLLLLCRRHHRAVHEGGFRVRRRSDGALVFFRPDGVPLEAAPQLPSATISGDDTLRRSETARGTAAQRGSPVFDGTPLDVGWAIDVLWTRSGGRAQTIP
jgi:hypothetical protein